MADDEQHRDEFPNEIHQSRRGFIRAASLLPVAMLAGPAIGQVTPGAPAGARPRMPIPKPGDIDTRLSSVNACILTPQSVEGPFYFETSLIRSDIREDQPGTPLQLNFEVIDANDCTPIADALVSVWQCNAEGYYSGYTFSNPNVGLPPANSTPKIPHQDPKTAERWLRGASRCDSVGKVSFQTIFPSWYLPRSPHIHLKVFLKSGAEIITTQYYFPQSVLNDVLNHGVYAKRGAGLITMESDFVRKQSGGLGPTFTVTQDASGNYIANAVIGVAHN
jgi:protocatechuate 3,4-dioxygenase beta subunit